jgi:hypothetical protein
MDIKRISGGIEYSQNLTSLVLPGDKNYRVKTIRTGELTVNTAIISSRVIMPKDEINKTSDNTLAFLRHLGELETSGFYLKYTSSNEKDRYAGGHRGIIDIWA